MKNCDFEYKLYLHERWLGGHIGGERGNFCGNTKRLNFDFSIVPEARFSNFFACGVSFLNCDFSECTFEDCDFTGGILRLSSCGGSFFENTKFVGSDLSGVDFTESEFHNVSFNGAILTRTNFTNAVLHDCTFEGAIIDGVVWDGTMTDGKCNIPGLL